MKQLLSSILILVLALSLTACGSKSEIQSMTNHSATSTEISTNASSSSEDLPTANESLEPTSDASIAEYSSDISTPNTASASHPLAEASSYPSTSTVASTESHIISESASSDVQSCTPADYRSFGSTDVFLEWLQSSKSSGTNAIQMSRNNQATQNSLLIPRVLNKELVDYGVAFEESSLSTAYAFRTYESDVINENQLYSVLIRPLSPNESNKNLKEYFLIDDRNEKVQISTYNGIEYAYADGYEGTGNKDRIFAVAWFIQNNYLIHIEATWSNSFKPWSTDYFDYFNFETIIL